MSLRHQLLGREEQIQALRQLMAGVPKAGSVLLVLGEPGIGKSALLVEARTLGRKLGFRVLAAAGVETETHLPFGGLHQILAPLMGYLDALPVAERDALATAFGLFEGPRPDLFLIAEAALSLLVKERGQRPVMVVADDVQWLDPQSAQILTFLGHRSPAAGLVLIAAARSGHEGALMAAGFPELLIPGVDIEAADAILLMHGRELTPADRVRVREQAMGNPLALLELPAVWDAGSVGEQHQLTLSARLEQAFAGRISELPEATRGALLVAAADSSSDLAEILAATATLAERGRNTDLFEPAVRAGLVTTDAEVVRFRHPLVRSGVLQMAAVADRQGAHRALAEVLPVPSYRRTWHRAHAITGPDDVVAEELEATVPELLQRGAVMAAVASLERAAQLTSSSALRGERLLKAAQHAFAVGRADVVARLVREAAATELSELQRARRAWLNESLNDDVSADPARVLGLTAAAATAAEAGDLDLALGLLLGAGLRCWWADNGPEAQRGVVDALDQLVIVRDDPRLLAALAIADPVARGAEVRGRLERVDLSAVVDADALRTYGMAAYAVGDLVLATDLLDRAEALLRATGRLGLLPVVLALQLHIRLDLGDWAGAESAAQEVARVSVETGQALYAFNNVLVESRALALRGDWQAALKLIVGAEDEAARLRLNDASCLAYQTRGAALLSGDRPTDAYACLIRQFQPSDPGYHLRESFAGLALMAEAAVDSGHLDEARAAVTALEAVVRVTPSPLLQVNLLYARAVVAPPEQAEAHYRDALEHDLTRWPWLRARVELEFGRWLIGRGCANEAATHLREAAEVFDRIGARRWSRRAETALLAAGGDRRGGTANAHSAATSR